MSSKFSFRINHKQIARALMKSGDLHKDDCACGLEYENDQAQELDELIDLALDVIEVFGEAGLRALVNRAEGRADGLDIQFRAKLAEEAEAKILAQAKLSEFDQIALLSVVGRIGGDMGAYDLASGLLLRGAYTAGELCRLPKAQLRELLM
ncbi:hypothetical protein KIH32_01200 [Pseudomonas fluorescens]|uniref:hypothetical protein n=1 Tax=Pseudomonas fluorescens TaxID=294 RepID=UPI001BDB37FA|nr:hypothetical protein [Pseudomonas fluorescens]MBT0622506.1 hypothetical protein [Pseudomonas fluorescens]